MEGDAGGSRSPLARCAAHRGSLSSVHGVDADEASRTPWSTEEEAQGRWARALTIKSASGDATKRLQGRTQPHEFFIRRELEALEDKVTRQVLRLQEQSERFMDIMMHPLESKVAALEGRQPAVDCSLAELRGNLKSLQDSVEMQVKRADNAETRLRKWRNGMEDDLHAKYVDLSRKLTEASGPGGGIAGRLSQDLVTRSELLDVTHTLKQELRRYVEDAAPALPTAATRKELADVAGYLREEISAVQAATRHWPAQTGTTDGNKAVPHEERRSASSSLTPLEEATRRSVEGLAERLTKSEQLLEQSKLDVRQLRAELQSELRSYQTLQASAFADLESELRSSQSSQASARVTSAVWEQATASLATRLQTIEERTQQSQAELLDQVQSGWQARAAELAGRLHALEQASAAWSQHGVGRDSRKENNERERELGELIEADAEEEEVSDFQLMLLDLQRRVSMLERTGPEQRRATTNGMSPAVPTAEAPSPAASGISEAAQLAQSLALNLRQARRTAGLVSARSGQHSARSDAEGLPPAPDDPPCLPPLAAMKVGLSPRLQQLNITPRAQSSTLVDSGAASKSDVTRNLTGDVGAVWEELRAEVAAVWDAVAELAELLGNSNSEAPGSVAVDGQGSSSVEAAWSPTVAYTGSIDSLNRDMRALRGEVERLDSRVSNCEQRIGTSSPKENHLDRMATFDARAGSMFSSLGSPVTLMSSTRGFSAS
eukprot:TRINITY_DN27530_c0_g1_i1.p1 TRINITY_DN27530_c0_g1~~TRINITY_DN27530_c0_g1_i1.p1  ORF type:complete len:732 (+),score=170.98 TRINITY_DN27530_c0_g1_i1:34-2196(+)